MSVENRTSGDSPAFKAGIKAAEEALAEADRRRERKIAILNVYMGLYTLAQDPFLRGGAPAPEPLPEEVTKYRKVR